MILTRRSDANGFDTNESTAYLPAISIGMSGMKPASVCIILDDASRMILAGGEFDAINTENSKRVIDQMVERYRWLCPIRELIFDRADAFGAHRVHENGNWDGTFKQHLEKYGIDPILVRVKHPQTNWKLERIFLEDISDIDMFSLHSRSLSGV